MLRNHWKIILHLEEFKVFLDGFVALCIKEGAVKSQDHDSGKFHYTDSWGYNVPILNKYRDFPTGELELIP